jgi:hypothetical protein
VSAPHASPHVPLPASSPDDLVTAGAFDAEIRQAIRFERGLAVKAVLSLAVVAAILAVHVVFFT